MRVPAVDAVVFNPSPNAFKGKLDRSLKNNHVILFEKGEALTGLTGWWLVRRLPDPVIIGNYNLIDFKFRTVSFYQEHRIYPLSRALLSVAMTVGESPLAKKMFTENIPRTQAFDTDALNCKPLYD